jgi:DtxR family Mn-dependent transcriptional regulator
MGVSERLEEYLEVLWISDERGDELAHIKWVAKHLGISPPTAVEILKKLEKLGLVIYKPRQGIKLSDKGREIAKRIIRGHRLIELLMKKTLKTEVREETVCGIEHHMDEDFMSALCTLLKHPRKCPHGNAIPRGKCCP